MTDRGTVHGEAELFERPPEVDLDPADRRPTPRRGRVAGGHRGAVVDRADIRARRGARSRPSTRRPRGSGRGRAGASHPRTRRPARSRSSTTRSTGPRRRACGGPRRPARRRTAAVTGRSRVHGGGARRARHLDDEIVAVVELGAQGLRHHGVLEVERRDVGELEDRRRRRGGAAAPRRGRRARDRGRRRDSRCRPGRRARRRRRCPRGRRSMPGCAVIFSSGMSRPRIDLACWLNTNWLPAAQPARI